MTTLHERLQDFADDYPVTCDLDRKAVALLREASTALQGSGGEVVAGKLEGDDRLLWGVVANAGRLSRERKVRWSHVMDATSMGSTSSVALCRRFGFNPDENVGGSDENETDDDLASPAQPSDAKDAARYRMIRDPSEHGSIKIDVRAWHRNEITYGRPLVGDRLDNEIDDELRARALTTAPAPIEQEG